MLKIWESLPQPWSAVVIILLAAYPVLELYLKYREKKYEYSNDQNKITTNNLSVVSNALGFALPFCIVMLTASYFQPLYGESIWYYVIFFFIGGIVMLFGAYYFWKKNYAIIMSAKDQQRHTLMKRK